MIADQMMTEFESPVNPFPGLRPFEFEESLLYFGRDGQSEQLLRKLVTARFMAVVGTSGSGKSSLIRAGLLPALFGGFMTSADSDWHIAIFRPSNDPIGNLARALGKSGLFGSPDEGNAGLQATMIESTLRRSSLGLIEAARLAQLGPNHHVLVVVDQFEELFRFAQVAEAQHYQNDAAAFVKLLLEASGQKETPIYVVLTMRSDFLGDCSLFWDLPEALNEGQYLIPRLTREQRREAITGPAAVCGATLTPRLINRLLNDMGDNSDQLPILQHALMRTWNRWKEEGRESEPIDLRHYEAIGAMRAALSRHADEAYNELPDDRSRAIAETMFKGLTEKGTDNREIRRPTELKELCDLTESGEAEVIAVVEVFRREGRSFLMPPAGTPLDGDSLIDISHESLIRNWERLKTWVDEEARSARIYRRLAETTVLHQKKEAGLFRDPDLELALDWREESKPNRTWARRYYPEFDASMNFLDQSREARDKEARDREAHRRKEIRRTRLTAIMFLVLFLSSLGAFIFANYERVQANESNDRLEVALDEAKMQKAIAEQEEDRAEEQAELARKESKAARLAEAEAKKLATIASKNEVKAEAATQKAREEKKRAEGEEARAEEETKRSRELLYAANLNLAQEAYDDANTQRAQQLLIENSDSLTDLRGFEWGYLRRLYDRNAGTLDAHGGDEVSGVAFSSSENRILATATKRTVKVWDASSGTESYSIPDQTQVITAFALSPDNKTLATASGNTVKLWAVGAKQQPTDLPSHDEPITALAFSPDSKWLATGSGDEGTGKGRLKLWDRSAHKRPVSIPDVTDDVIHNVRSLAFSADSKMLAVASSRDASGGEVMFFSLAASRAERVFNESPYFLNDITSPIALSPDGKILIVGTDNGKQFAVFDITRNQKRIATLEGFQPLIGDDPLAREGSSEGVTIRPRIQTAVAFSPDGRKIAVGVDDNLKLYDSTGLKESTPPKPLGSLVGQEGPVTSISFSADGRLLATNDHGKVRLWDTRMSRDYVTLATSRERHIVLQVGFSPNSEAVLSTTFDGQSEVPMLWDTASQRKAVLPGAPENTIGRSAVSSNGKFLATINRDSQDTLKLWDTETRDLVASLKEPSNPQNVGNDEAVAMMAVSPDGKTLATISHIIKKPAPTPEIYLKLWDTDSQQGPTILKSDLVVLLSATFAPDGKTLACVGADNKGGVVQLWDVATQKVELLRASSFRAVKAIVFSGDGKRFAIVGYSAADPLAGAENFEHVELWEAIPLNRIAVAAVKLSRANASFSSDMKTLAITGEARDAGRSVLLWDTVSHKTVKLRGHENRINCVGFSADGKTIATGSDDKHVKLWSATSLRMLVTFDNGEQVHSVAFSPDSRMMITGGASGAVKLYQTNSEIGENRKP